VYRRLVAELDVRRLLQLPESEWLDFKQKHHDNAATFLHDVLCLANAYSENDRYLVLGVGDDRKLHGVASDDKRRTDRRNKAWNGCAGV
jgi:hypothetical protein